MFDQATTGNLVLALIYSFVMVLALIMLLGSIAVVLRTRRVRQFRYFTLEAGFMAWAGGALLVAFASALVNTFANLASLPPIMAARWAAGLGFLLALIFLATAVMISAFYWTGVLNGVYEKMAKRPDPAQAGDVPVLPVPHVPDELVPGPHAIDDPKSKSGPGV